MEQVIRKDINPVRVTTHAQERMEEFHISYNKLVWMLHHSEEERPVHLGHAKERKYGGNKGIRYLRQGPYIMTIRNQPDNRTQTPITLVITIVDQRIGLKHVPKGEGSWTQ